MKRILTILVAVCAALNLKMLRFSLLAVVAAAHLAAQNMFHYPLLRGANSEINQWLGLGSATMAWQ